MDKKKGANGANMDKKRGATGAQKRCTRGQENGATGARKHGATGVPPEITNGANALPAEDPSASEVKFANFGLPLLSVVIFGVFVLTKYTF